MKNVILSAFILAGLLLWCNLVSCNSDSDNANNANSTSENQNQEQKETFESEEEEEKDWPLDFGVILNLNVRVVIVDEALKDRLNPESSAFFGVEYTDEIKVLYLCEGKKLSFLEYYYYRGGGKTFWYDDVEKRKPVFPPYRKIEDLDIYQDQGSLGYYFIDCSIGAVDGVINMEDGRKVTYTYISYPDGSEDEIKVQIYENEKGSMVLINKIWLNGELAFDNHWNGFETLKAYYNPKYYPWLTPAFDKEGNQIGFRPDGQWLLVLTK